MEAQSRMAWWSKLTGIGKAMVGVLAFVIIAAAIMYGPDLIRSVLPGSPSADSSASVDGDDPINVCVVSWVGYAGGEYFNKGFTASDSSRYFQDYGLSVNFKVMNDPLASLKAWESDECQVHWWTADAFTTLAGNLQEAGEDPRIIFQADWSRGGDVIVVTRDIQRMEDLRGKRISVAYGTPSHTFLLRALEAAGMTVQDVLPVEVPDAITAADVFKAGEVDAAVTWSPSDQEAMDTVTGSHVLTDTREATHIIADIFFAKQEYIEENTEKMTQLIEGWLIGAAELNGSAAAREQAIDVLTAGDELPRDFWEATINNARWTTYGDNLLFFGLERGDRATVTGERLYMETGELYQKYTNLVEELPSWRDIVNLDPLKGVNLETTGDNAAESAPRFATATETEAEAPAVSELHLTVNFETNSASLDNNAKSLIDQAFVPTARSFSSMRVRIEGNTDATGSREHNITLSRRRAEAVADYLAHTHEFDRNRFLVVGNGPDEPVCVANDTPECRARNRRTDFELVQTGR